MSGAGLIEKAKACPIGAEMILRTRSGGAFVVTRTEAGVQRSGSGNVRPDGWDWLNWDLAIVDVQYSFLTFDRAGFAKAIETKIDTVPMATRLYPDYFADDLAAYLIDYLTGKQ